MSLLLAMSGKKMAVAVPARIGVWVCTCILVRFAGRRLNLLLLTLPKRHAATNSILVLLAHSLTCSATILWQFSACFDCVLP